MYCIWVCIIWLTIDFCVTLSGENIAEIYVLAHASRVGPFSHRYLYIRLNSGR